MVHWILYRLVDGRGFVAKKIRADALFLTAIVTARASFWSREKEF